MAAYCSIEDLRAEGITETQATDARLRVLIAEASATIERLTGWFFEPRSLVLRLDGRGSRSVEPPFPPIRLDRVSVGFEELSLDDEELLIVGAPVLPGFDAPRITRTRGVFARGYGNVAAVGTWGFTEADGSTLGRTPLAIRRACMVLVTRLLRPVGDSEAVEDARNAWRIVELRTRDQSVRYAPNARAVELTGDGELDELLLPYRRPPSLGAA